MGFLPAGIYHMGPRNGPQTPNARGAPAKLWRPSITVGRASRYGFLTVTGSVVVAVWPFIVTESVNVRAPLATLLVFQVYQSVVPVRVWVVTTLPSTDSLKVLVWPQVAVVAMPMVCLPLTVAPAPGYVNDAVNDAAFATV